MALGLTRSHPSASCNEAQPIHVKSESTLSVSIVICTRNRPDDLRACLKAISQLHTLPDEVLVIDNTLGQPEVEHAALASGARYLPEPNPGLSRARNRGLSESRCDIVVYLDDDSRPTEDWLGYLVEPFRDPLVAAVTGDTVPSRSDLASSRETTSRSLSNRDPLWFEIAAFGGLGIGANMALRKSACVGWKVFEERLGRGAPFRIGEESYAFISLLARGFHAVHVPPAVVVHPLKQIDVALEAKCAIAYYLLLFNEFPSHRLEIMQFLFRRLRRRPLPWPRLSLEACGIISSGWSLRLKAALAGVALFLSTPKPRD